MWLCQALILSAGSVTGSTEGGKRRNMQRKYPTKRWPIGWRQGIMMPSQKTVRCQMRTGDKRLVIQTSTSNFWTTFFSCIYVTKLAEFLHGVAFVFLEGRCYSIEDTRFFCFVRCLERSGFHTQKFGNGPFLFFFYAPNPTYWLPFHTSWKYAFKLCLSQTADPNHFFIVVPTNIPTPPIS